MVFLAFISEVLRCRHTVGEGDGDCVERWLPPGDPSCLTGSLGVQPLGEQVQALQGGLLGREVSAHAEAGSVTFSTKSMIVCFVTVSDQDLKCSDMAVSSSRLAARSCNSRVSGVAGCCYWRAMAMRMSFSVSGMSSPLVSMVTDLSVPVNAKSSL